MIYIRIVCLVTAALLVGNAVAAPVPLAEVDTKVATVHQQHLHCQAVDPEAPSLTTWPDDADIYGRWLRKSQSKAKSDHAIAIEDNWAAAHAHGIAKGEWQHLADQTSGFDRLAAHTMVLHHNTEYEASQKKIAQHRKSNWRPWRKRPNAAASSAAAQDSYDEATASAAEARNRLALHRS